jgi:methanogenic corrinoid protein MtbC1
VDVIALSILDEAESRSISPENFTGEKGKAIIGTVKGDLHDNAND